MKRRRIKLEVWVDLDNVPGTFHTKDSARNVVANLLNQSIDHYNPMVSTTNEEHHYDPKP